MALKYFKIGDLIVKYMLILYNYCCVNDLSFVFDWTYLYQCKSLVQPLKQKNII